MPGRGSTGRPGALDEARRLVALVASLSEAGDALSVDGVSEGLGVSRERAEKLISLVLTSATGGMAQMPLVEDGGEVTLLLSGGMRGRRLRLTRSETVAVVAALDALGVPADDPLRERLGGALASEGVSKDLVSRVVSAGAAGGEAETIRVVAEALARREGLSFSYRKAGDGRPGVGGRADSGDRRVLPRELRLDRDVWYLDALDLDRQGERTFRLDRMGDVRPLPHQGPGPGHAEGTAAGNGEHEGTGTVCLTFLDPSYLDLLEWHDLTLAGTDEQGHVTARTPWWGGDWLPRMICACGGAVTTTDARLAEAVRREARALLDG